MLAPFLQEVRVALSFGDYGVQSVRLYPHLLIQGRLGYCGTRVCFRKRTDFGELEQPFGVGLGSPHVAPSLRQAGPNQHYGQLSLGRSVKRGNQRRQFVFFHVLNFVYEQRDTTFVRPRCFPARLQQVLKVRLQVTVVSEARFRLEIQPDFDVLVLHLQRTRESR